jgi:hypothetical protein
MVETAAIAAQVENTLKYYIALTGTRKASTYDQ